MKFHCTKLSTLPFHRQFMWIFIITFTVSFLCWNVAIILQTVNVWKPSMKNSNDFVNNNNAFSLKSYSQLMGRTLYSHMDLDSSWMILVMNTILNLSPKVLILEYESVANDEVLVKNYSYAATYFSKPNNTIFSNKVDPHIDKLLTAVFSPAIEIFVKRMNIIYYNNQEMTDIMIKTVPADPDFQFRDPEQAVSRLLYAFQGFFFLAPSYNDVFSKNFSNLRQFAQRTKIVFQNYTILIDFEVLPGGPSAKSMQFPIFQDVDQHMIYLNPTNLSQIGVMTQSTPLRDDINYFGLMKNGFYNFYTNNGTQGYSFTLRMQMAHKIGQFHIPSNNVTDGSFVYLIIHGFESASFILQQYMSDVTKGAQISIQKFIIVWTIAFGLILLSLVMLMQRYLKAIQTNLTDSIQKFYKSQLEGRNYQKLKSDERVYWAAHINLVRYTKRIISMIRHRRTKNRTEQNIKNDIWPLNKLSYKFERKYFIEDLQKLSRIKRLLKDIDSQQRRQKSRKNKGRKSPQKQKRESRK